MEQTSENVPGDAASKGVGASTKATPSLTPEQLAEIGRATVRGRKLRRAAIAAYCDAWITAAFAGLTLPCALFGLSALAIGGALGIIAVNSFRGAKMLKQYDLRGPRLLAWNQIALMGVLIVYAACMLYSGLTGRSEMDDVMKQAGMSPGDDMGLGALNHLIYGLVYGGLIVGTIVGQGLAAWYYAGRERAMREYLEQTPAWIVELYKS